VKVDFKAFIRRLRRRGWETRKFGSLSLFLSSAVGPIPALKVRRRARVPASTPLNTRDKRRVIQGVMDRQPSRCRYHIRH